MKAVIVGLGYVGLPLATAASRAGVEVTGLDLNRAIVDGLNAGRSHIDDLDDATIADIVARGFRATSDSSVIAGADYVVICVPTPLDRDGRPDLAAVIGAGRAIGERLTAGTTVILESTTYPGTTQEVLQPLLEASGLRAGREFHLAFSPERIDPGNKRFTIINTPKVVGGITADATDKAAQFYRVFIETVVPARGVREAEMAKLLENTYRHVNIALVNEMAQFSHSLGIDIWEVVRLAATKPFGFQSFRPGAGVGGHCIPIDPNYLAYKVRAELDRPFRFVELAEEINQSMPTFVSRRVQDLLNEQRKSVNGSTVLLLGVTYKADISDRRESPAVPLAERLLRMGADLRYHDPSVRDWSVDGLAVPDAGDDLTAAIADSDVVIIVQPHSVYLEQADEITGAGVPVLDTTGRFAGADVERL